jgi:hypothetical protein
MVSMWFFVLPGRPELVSATRMILLVTIYSYCIKKFLVLLPNLPIFIHLLPYRHSRLYLINYISVTSIEVPNLVNGFILKPGMKKMLN